MKVAFFYWPAGWASGHETFQATLLEGLLAQDRHPITVVIDREVTGVHVDAPHVVRTYFRKRARFADRVLVRDLTTEAAATDAVRSANVDSLIACANYPHPQVRELPFLATLHETDFMEPAPWNWFAPRWLEQMCDTTVRALRTADAVLANSQYTAKRACNEFGIPAQRAVVTSPGVRPFEGGEDRLPKLPPYVAQVGWFHPRKNASLVIDAWVAARRRGVMHDLVLIGRPGPRDRVHGSLARQVVERGKEFASNIHIMGLVDRVEYGRLIGGAAALLVGSHQEGFCVPVIEAFSLGTPVVAVNRTALTEVAGAFGILVEPTTEAFADGICRALSSRPDREAMQRYAASFTPQNQAAPALRVLDAIEDGSWAKA